MKKLISVVLLLSVCLCLGGCVLLGGQDLPSCVSGESGSYVLTLPETEKTIKVGADEEIYLKSVTDKLVADAEKALLEKCGDNYSFYLEIKDGYLCLCAETIVEKEPVGENLEDHDHLFYSEKISTK